MKFIFKRANKYLWIGKKKCNIEFILLFLTSHFEHCCFTQQSLRRFIAFIFTVERKLFFYSKKLNKKNSEQTTHLSRTYVWSMQRRNKVLFTFNGEEIWSIDVKNVLEKKTNIYVAHPNETLFLIKLSACYLHSKRKKITPLITRLSATRLKLKFQFVKLNLFLYILCGLFFSIIRLMTLFHVSGSCAFSSL